MHAGATTRDRLPLAIDAARASAARIVSVPTAASSSRLRSFVESASFGDDVLRCETQDDIENLRRRLLRMHAADCSAAAQSANGGRLAGSPRTAAKQTIGEMRAAKIHIMSLLSKKKSAGDAEKRRKDGEECGSVADGAPSAPPAAPLAFSYLADIPPPSPPAFSLSRAITNGWPLSRR